jgi:hypothetical protein
MGPVTYIVVTLICLASSILLLRGYMRDKMNLLLWSGVCFAGLAVSNLLVFVDLVMLPNANLYLVRLITAAASMALLLFGLIWESD